VDGRAVLARCSRLSPKALASPKQEEDGWTALRQNPGRIPECRQRASGARDDEASAYTVQVPLGDHPSQSTPLSLAFRLRGRTIVQ
jgi:hypothetical protein